MQNVILNEVKDLCNSQSVHGSFALLRLTEVFFDLTILLRHLPTMRHIFIEKS
jgi:hypothetical protein